MMVNVKIKEIYSGNKNTVFSFRDNVIIKYENMVSTFIKHIYLLIPILLYLTSLSLSAFQAEDKLLILINQSYTIIIIIN